jgi:adenine-specific DNA-methyltransferase
MWMLDPDYDGRSLFPRQVFFIADIMQDGLKQLAETLRAEIDPELIRAYYGKVSLPFEAGAHRRAAVKIVDDRGIESIRVIGLD